MFESKQQETEETQVSYWISYTDILASLLIIILLITVYAISKLEATQHQVIEGVGELNQAENIRKETLTRIEKKLKKSGINVEIAENYRVLRIPHSELSFQTNKYDIPISMKRDLDKIGRTIINELKKNKRSVFFETIFIEGHTDDRPSKLPKGNMGLSTFRAISVWEHWSNRVSKDFRNLKNKNGKKLFSVSGYGETRPIQKVQRTAYQMKQNRRIDIRFTLHKPESFEYNQIIEMFENN